MDPGLTQIKEYADFRFRVYIETGGNHMRCEVDLIGGIGGVAIPNGYIRKALT